MNERMEWGLGLVVGLFIGIMVGHFLTLIAIFNIPVGY